MNFYTIGVYNRSEIDFFDKIIENKIDLFCDIRQRRGVRGAKYSFVNSKRLQAKLVELNINYIHIKELAPTKEIRELQKKADIENKELKRKREKLGELFSIEYKHRILNNYDFLSFFKHLRGLNAKRILFFCVEEKPDACHRSLVTDKLHQDYGYKTIHL